MNKSILSVLVFCIAILSSGCSSSVFHAKPLAYGAGGGAVAGAGTGAIVGALIANGDIAASAMLGGAIGIPVGLAIGMAYDYYSDQTLSEKNAVEIQKNQIEIYKRQRELDNLREQIRNDGPTGNPSESDRYYHYNGNTYGNYYR
jgi:phage tail tape-measure protein